MLVAIMAMHALLLWLWPQWSPTESSSGARKIFITWIPSPPPTVTPPPKPKALAAQRPTRPSRPAAITQPAPVMPTQPEAVAAPARPVEPAAITMPAAPDPFAEPAPVAGPKYDMSRIDREVRKESRDPAVRVTVLQAPKLERLLAGAKKQRGPAPIEELVLGDGRRVSKVGGMCASKKSSAMVGGNDPFRNGNHTVWQECPR